MPINTKRSKQMVYSWTDETVGPRNTIYDDVDPDFSVDHELEDEEETIPPSDQDKPDEPSCQRILNIECGIKRSLDIGIVYEDGTRKDVTISKGNKVQISYIEEAKLQTAIGVITGILQGPKTLNRITNKYDHVYSIKLDHSSKYSSKRSIIYCELIRDINILTRDNDVDVDKEYLEQNYFSKDEVDYIMSWQDVDGTEIE